MSVKTLVAGYEPPELKTLKGAQLKRHTYFQDTLAKFNLGELRYMSVEEAKAQIENIDPLLVLTFDDFTAREINEIKADNLTYVIDTPNQIFARKAEIEEKQEKLNKILTEAEGIIVNVIDGKDDEKSLRQYAAMSYNDMYDMIKEAFISDDKKLREGARELLFGDGERHSNIVWMKVQLMAEVWDHADGKGREELMCMSMERHVDQHTARKMDNFTDADGQDYHQYMFLDPYGNDLNHIRRLPFGEKKQDKYTYEKMLEDNEIPTNYLRIQVEANIMRDQWDEHLQAEREQVAHILEEWKANPSKSKKELGVVPHDDGSADEPLNKIEIRMLKSMCK